ncbi:MAG TPA: DUF192 domain-containing protein [Candidatus Angelobacter sp.]|jgi:uncharacterized membrane protein (UPF0127 family)|nr:DUF192 domain-containing protein [Candidatus Angelobacter sp.]
MDERRLETVDGGVVAPHVEVAGTAWRRFMGLMFRSELPAGHGLALTPCSSIHMFFMRIPLDVAFLDREGRVLRVYHGIRPWRVSRVVRGARTAVELPAGTLREAGVEKGAVLRLA